MRYFAEVAYLGTRYHGWQKQANANSIQGEIETVLSTLLNEPLSIIGSGRTDTGVHACQQYFHFDTQQDIDLSQLKYKMNAMLHHDIVIKIIKPVKDDAHVRFDAIRREYIYRIKREKDPFTMHQAYQYSKKLDVLSMNAAAQYLLGEHNFQSFSKVKTNVNNFFCNVFQAEWFEDKDELKFHIAANRFLRGMVRAIVGSTLMVGEGKISVEDFNNIILKKDRKSAGRSVPAEGLFLYKVDYPEEIFEKR